MSHERMKHKDIRYHFIHKVIARDDFIVHKISTHENPAGMIIKTHLVSKFELYLDLVGAYC